MKNSVVVDPFAGRATRAIISSKLGRKYYGYEISPKTFGRSVDKYKLEGVLPTLYLSDGCKLEKTDNNFAHLVMTCPPYGTIEKYESVSGQLSDISDYTVFLQSIQECAKNIERILKPGGFCCWVVGDWRDSGGFRQFSVDSVNLFKNAGLIPHDTVIIKNNSPFAALQAGKAASKRITSKIHEYILVFRKSGTLDVSGLESDTWIQKNNFID
jgi:DNA modification methylase